MDTSTDIANALDHDIAALKAKAADFDARHQLIEKVHLAAGRAHRRELHRRFRRHAAAPPAQRAAACSSPRASSAAASASGG